MMIVSACLAGFPCRYDGKARPCAQVVELVRAGKAIPVCPEQLGGLPTPRTSCEIREGRVVDADGRDRTEAFQRGAKAVLRIAQTYGATEALLQSRSPSCGSGWIYDGSFTKTLTAGDGVTARLLKENGIQVTAL
ncbi:MAG: DUF523 domain-containing protein [Clostridia bacterium]|nr:DUF523 domain-containing protein [Clostridia bacterium]MBR0422630.1 DUF523 domain-containing protein [Clostridia bacterium]